MKFDTSVRQTRFDSPLGPVILAATQRGLAGVWFAGQRHLPTTAHWPVDDHHPVMLQARQQLLQYFAGERDRFDMPLDIAGGTAFQQTVWQAMLAIPFGTTRTYGSLGNQIGKPRAVRAVGAAVGRNPMSIIVPCHRVLGADGSLTGYAGGLDRKVALLRLEAASA